MTSRKKIIVTFADIRGSSRWMRRMAEDDLNRHHFMLAYDREANFYKSRTDANFYKRIGDGRMLVYELGAKPGLTALNVLMESLGFVKRVERLIAGLPSPRPVGFRVRLMAGNVVNEKYEDGESDWIGYVPNTCHKLLSIKPDISVLAQESFKELVSGAALKKRGFAFAHLKPDRRCPDGVDQEDIDSLYSVVKIEKEK